MLVVVYNYDCKDIDIIAIDENKIRFPGFLYDVDNKILNNNRFGRSTLIHLFIKNL